MKAGDTMEPIQRAMKKMTNNPDFNERFEKLKREVLQDEHIAAFLTHHQSEINNLMLQKSMGKLYEFLGQTLTCEGCASIESCKNLLKGYKPILAMAGGRIDVRYEKCDTRVKEEKRKQLDSLFQSMYIPKEVLKASISNLFHDKGRFDVVKLAIDFVKNYQVGEFKKGLYLYGSFGIGKTYLLAAIANELAKKEIQTLLIYTPEFMREMKNSFKDQSINEKIDSIKKVPILMLDDIGAESMSSWFRDEILGTILQYRMMEELPIFFSSNLSFRELEHHLTYSQRGEIEEVKAARIMQRIKALAQPAEMNGQNYRE